MVLVSWSVQIISLSFHPPDHINHLTFSPLAGSSMAIDVPAARKCTYWQEFQMLAILSDI